MMKNIHSGTSLVEILVVILIFSFLAVIVTRSILLTIAGAKKSDAIQTVRQDINHSLGIIQRQIIDARSLAQNCPGSGTRIDFYDQYGTPTSFSCQGVMGAPGSFIASGSAALTRPVTVLFACSFTCTKGIGDRPDIVTVTIDAGYLNASGIQNVRVSETSNISLRNY